MIKKLTAIVLDVVKHTDSKNIVTLFTLEEGRLTCVVPGGATRAAAMRRAILRPLSVVDTEIRFNASRDIQFMGSASLHTIWRHLYYDPYKSAVAMMIGEFLNRYLRTSAPDAPAFSFIVRALDSLDRMERGVANFHIAFLIRFLEVAGVQPDLSGFEPGDSFDLLEGTPIAHLPRHRAILSPEEAGHLPRLMRMDFRNLHRFRFSAPQRRELTARLLDYYALYFPGVNNMKSPDILRDLFNN